MPEPRSTRRPASAAGGRPGSRDVSSCAAQPARRRSSSRTGLGLDTRERGSSASTALRPAHLPGRSWPPLASSGPGRLSSPAGSSCAAAGLRQAALRRPRPRGRTPLRTPEGQSSGGCPCPPRRGALPPETRQLRASSGRVPRASHAASSSSAVASASDARLSASSRAPSSSSASDDFHDLVVASTSASATSGSGFFAREARVGFSACASAVIGVGGAAAWPSTRAA